MPDSKGEGNQYRESPLDKPLPAPIGVNCPVHPSYPLVWAVQFDKPDQGWCRRGQHFIEFTPRSSNR